MNFKNNKGYSLVEIGVGILILTIFLLFSVGLINGCYTNYRRIKQRNLAVNRAIYHTESLLQRDKNLLSGYLEEVPISSTEIAVEPNTQLVIYVEDNFEEDFKLRYASYKKEAASSITERPSRSDIKKYILNDIDYVVNQYIGWFVISHTPSGDLKTGDYGFLDSDGLISGPKTVTISDDADTMNESYIASNNSALRVRRTIKRIPAENGKAYGNNVLKIKVEVFYPKNGKAPSREDIRTITGKNDIRQLTDAELDLLVNNEKLDVFVINAIKTAY